VKKTGAKFIVSDWGNNVDSGIGLSYRPARKHWFAGRYDNPMPEPTIFRQSGTMNLATDELNHSFFSFCIFDDLFQKGGKRRGETSRMSLPSQLERTPHFGSWGLLRVHLLLCPSKIFRHGNKILPFPCNGIFSLILLCIYKLPGNGIGLLSIPQMFYTEFWHGLALVINIPKCKEQRHYL
jgi:hypothetical protein